MRLHVVRAGENLTVIARRHKVSWRELARVNSLRSPYRIDVGQRLFLPGTPAAPPVRRTPIAVQAEPHTLLALLGAAARRVMAIELPATIRPPATPQDAAPAPEPEAAAAGDVTAEQLRAIMPDAGTRIATYLGPLNTAMRAHNITAPEQRAAFLAQISAESGQLRNVVENLNYSAPRLRQVWPRRFPDDATARTYARNPEALANYVYADRLGNGGPETGDGWRYRGRGLMQTTGRDNYRRAGFENNPEALANPITAADSAGRFWAGNGLNARTTRALARGPFNAVSRTVNGGDHGSTERWQAYQRALAALRPSD